MVLASKVALGVLASATTVGIAFEASRLFNTGNLSSKQSPHIVEDKALTEKEEVQQNDDYLLDWLKIENQKTNLVDIFFF